MTRGNRHALYQAPAAYTGIVNLFAHRRDGLAQSSALPCAPLPPRGALPRQVAASGLLFCIRPMETEETNEMMHFLGNTVQFATPQAFAAGLAQAKTDEEREMIAFRRAAFLYYHQALAEAGLEEPLGPPFIEG